MKIWSSYPEDMYEGSMELTLEAGGKMSSISFGTGEPEDNSLARDLSDAMKIEGMLIAAYNAGKNGEDFELISEEPED